MNDVAANAPDVQVHFFGDGQGRMGIAIGDEIQAALATPEPFDGQFAVNDRNHDVAIMRFDGPIDDQEVTIVDARLHH